MSFWNKIKFGFMRFMQGRYGSDQLGMTLVWAALIFYVIGSFSGLGIFGFLSLAGWGWALYRMLSRNTSGRRAENERYLTMLGKVKTPVAQAVVRFKNRKVYCYFDCPKCHKHLRLPRGVGKVTVTCSQCGNVFEKKA